MSQKNVSFFIRIFRVWGVFFKYLFSGDFARKVHSLPTADATPAPEKPQLLEAGPDSALQLLGLLQQEGRFIDFIEENVASFSDTEVGAAARVVHEGCRKVIKEHLQLEPIRSEDEGTAVTLESGFNASAVRLTGNVVGEAPFRGTLTHRGWRAADITLPKVSAGHDVSVLAAAEVEL